MYVAALFSIEEIKTLNEEDEVKIILIPFIKEKKKKQKKTKKKDTECASNARPSGSLTTALPRFVCFHVLLKIYSCTCLVKKTVK